MIGQEDNTIPNKGRVCYPMNSLGWRILGENTCNFCNVIRRFHLVSMQSLAVFTDFCPLCKISKPKLNIYEDVAKF